MFSHVTVGTNDFARAAVFYDAVLATLGHKRFVSGEHHAGYGLPNDNQFWLLRPFDRDAATPGNGSHVAFLAPSRDVVRAFHAAALAHGGSDEGAPGLRPHYHPNYYGAYMRDPDGNKIQAVCHRSE
ncbi:MAG: VOC family protein [Alphaproteobacteria bacterium]|nr:VOC family protein [Alphaproteobacteria bacterium]